ncbi:MAG TPA: NUDIX hydrolase [Bacteroidia bacterium]|jgi:mutator protein MutT|nr:NUDIX hydrolase [Bacteroidia bacterium]
MNIFLRFITRIAPSDMFSKRYPVSVKGIIFINNKIVLLKNERNEWELPGGKIDPNETPEQCLVREIKEELNINAETHSLIDVWIYNILNKIDVLIVTYLCLRLVIEPSEIKISSEHKELGLFSPEEINGLNMPEGYKNSIRKALKIIA